MKKLIVACFMIFGVATVLSAQDTTSTSTQQSDQYRTDDSNTDQDTMSTTSPQDNQYRTDDSDTEQDTTSTAQQSDQYRTSESSTTSQPTDVSTDDTAEGEAEMISTVDLPATVREQLTSEDYSGWTVSQAHRKVKDGVTYYKVELVNGDEKKKVKFDSQGNVLKEKDHSEHTEKAKDKY